MKINKIVDGVKVKLTNEDLIQSEENIENLTQIENIQEKKQKKQEKSLKINELATLSDQLNALMEINYKIVTFIWETKPEILEIPEIKQGLELRENIKNILNK